jgi:hypothetical protein
MISILLFIKILSCSSTVAAGAGAGVAPFLKSGAGAGLQHCSEYAKHD